MERIRRGDIWTVELVSFPKPRPALVISIDAVNDVCADILVVPITSVPGPLRVPLALEPTGLHHASFAKCESVGPLHKSRLKTRIGRLAKTDWSIVEAGLKRVLGFGAV